jgi:hypothetical protein
MKSALSKKKPKKPPPLGMMYQPSRRKPRGSATLLTSGHLDESSWLQFVFTPLFRASTRGPRCPDIARPCLRFAHPHEGPHCPDVTRARIACAPPASHAHPMWSTCYTFETFRYNTYNIQGKSYKTLKTCVRSICKNTWKYLEIIANICNIQIKHLQHMCETFATSR